MRDAFGGIVNLSMIVVFLVLVCGYLAFNVNYTKAFRVKNYIITTIEQYEGNCDNTSSACAQKIDDYIKQVDIPLAETYTTASITDFKMAVGHRYLLQVFVEGEETSDRIWIYFKDSGNGEGYEFEYENKQSYLNVTEDNVTVNAEISEYRVL